MILTCPNCGTQYAVKDGAIPAQGRKVRCAACGESWHQDPGEFSAESTAEAEQPAASDPAAEDIAASDSPYESIPEPAEDDEDESLAEAALIEPREGPEAEERAFQESVVEQAEPSESVETDWRDSPEAEPQADDFARFDDDDLDEPRRRRLLPLLLVFLTVAVLTTLFWFLAPDEWKSRLGLATQSSALTLLTPQMHRQRLESGNELLTVTGGVANPTGKNQDVPPLTAKLRTKDGRVVHSWTIAPPARTLAPGGRANFNSSKVDVPPGGEELVIMLGGKG
jgi:predicted Zn finger-like uncharacterized protein